MKLIRKDARAVGLLASISTSILAAHGTAMAAERGTEEIVTTATRVAQPLSEVIGSVSVITREDIQRRMVHSVQDLLRGEAGISVINHGGLGKLSNVFMRGADAEQVLVLIDGVRVGSATSGTTAFELLPVDQIERIEIVRGPRSSLYGSDAVGGVIQIFTRRGAGPAFGLSAGSHETYETNASFGATTENTWFSVSGGRIQTEGYNSCDGAPFPPGGGCFTREPDRDGYDNTSGSARAGYRWDERGEIEASALYARGNTEFDGSFSNETDFVERVLSLRGNFAPSDALNLSFAVGESRDEQQSLYDDPRVSGGARPTTVFDTVRRHASLQADLSFAAAQLLTVGADYVDDEVASTTAFDETSRDNIGIFGQYQWQLGAHHLLASARHDDNEQFGSYRTGSLGWKWALSPTLSVTAAWNTAFGAPTFNDLYYPGFSNPDLDPERSRSYELGLAGSAAALSWSLTAFESRVRDLIVFDSSISAPNNVDEARIRGIEAQADATLGEWRLGLGYTGLDPRNRSPGANFDNLLPRRVRHSGHIEIARGFGPIDARARVTAEGSRYDNVANTRRLGSYAVLDLVVDYAVNEEWSLQGKVGNALDRDYRTVPLYNQDGRTYFVSLRYQPR
jgi:vitamin B12 transporter